jgi:hypothetical protein
MITSSRAFMNWKPRDPGSVERSGARVFVGIKVAPEIARDLATIARSLEAYPVRHVRPADIHLTLVPPWSEMNIAGAVETLRTAVRPFGSLDLVSNMRNMGRRSNGRDSCGSNVW